MPSSLDTTTLPRIREARLTQSRAAVELWNARLSLLSAAGDIAGLLGHLASPAELAGDNCTCNNACNAPCAAPDLRPAPERSRPPLARPPAGRAGIKGG